MTAVTVRRDGHDWLTECAHHDDAIWCFDWMTAMEAAWGHIAMWHPRECDHEYGWHPVDRPDEHKCVDCGILLPLGDR